MAVRYESACFGCDWYTCSGCQYSGSYPVVSCDTCGHDFDDDESIYLYGANVYCFACADNAGAFYEDEDGDLVLNEDEWEEMNVSSYENDITEYDDDYGPDEDYYRDMD